MTDLINLITNNGIGIVCVAYLIYFQSTTMTKMIDTLGSIDNRLQKIENRIEVKEDEQWNYLKKN